MTASAGEIWLADGGGEARRPVLVISDARFNRLAERVVFAPVLDEIPAVPRPWHIPLSESRVAAVNQLGTMSIDRLLERVDLAGFDALRLARRAVRAMTS